MKFPTYDYAQGRRWERGMFGIRSLLVYECVDEFGVVSRQDNVMVADGVLEEIVGDGSVFQLYHLLGTT